MGAAPLFFFGTCACFAGLDKANDLVLLNWSSLVFMYIMHKSYSSLLQMKKSIYSMYSILQYHNASDWILYG